MRNLSFTEFELVEMVCKVFFIPKCSRFHVKSLYFWLFPLSFWYFLAVAWLPADGCFCSCRPMMNMFGLIDGGWDTRTGLQMSPSWSQRVFIWMLMVTGRQHIAMKVSIFSAKDQMVRLRCYKPLFSVIKKVMNLQLRIKESLLLYSTKDWHNYKLIYIN